MRFSFNWLKRYLRTDLTIAEIADKLTALGLEAEKVEDPATVFKNFKLVQIKSAEKHPAADKLKICVVEDAAGAELSIVCGAKNARVGLKTILAMPGAVIPGSGETLKKSKIRGVASEGMMCSASELTISSDSEGIIEIDPNVDLSTSIADVLGCDGGSIDVSLTPNRGDCFSVKGIARDLAAGGAGEFIAPEKIVCQPSFKFPINIEYEDNKSLRQYAATFAFRVIRGVKNGESPQWLKTALKSAGMNGASALVDLSNFYMIDSGKPTHLYDAKKIKGDFRIRFAANGEIFQDIKGNEHKLFSDMLIAADDESPLCLLGVMGGQRIACDENTTDILIESALFNRVWITRTGTVANITSDARTRFERGVDLDSSVSGLEELTKLILENCGGEASDIFVIGERPLKGADEIELTNEIPLRKSRLDSAGGREFDWDEVKLILKKLGLKEIKSGENESTFTAPSWRSDLKIEEDLIEEVLRIKGYDGVSSKSIDIVA
ncbi:MAG: phenylalanine--tRNA ligase subunit beta, partial [Holosporaceae bacterium]|nr:phenylalanine--tRNA ligase subunit beta [Holosporaceae bacterium]